MFAVEEEETVKKLINSHSRPQDSRLFFVFCTVMSMLSVSSDVLDSGDEDSSEEDDRDVESLIVKQSVCCLESEAVTLPDKLVLESEASGGEDEASEAGESSLEVQSPPDPGTECPVTESIRELLPDTEAICLQDQSVSHSFLLSSSV